MKKKGFELSINFIVVILLAVVVFGLGMLMLNKFLGGAVDIKSELDERTDTQLSNLLQAGQKVVIPFNSATIPRGDYHIFGLGILNAGEEANFKVNIILSKALDKDNLDMTSYTDISTWLRYDKNVFSLGRNEQRKEIILAEVPKSGAVGGTYILNVEIRRRTTGDWQIYDRIKKIYITVP